MYEVFIEQEDSKYNEGVLLDYYNGQYSLVRARRGSNGTVYKDWCFPQNKDRAPGPKSLPWKITLGAREEAISALRQILDALTGGNSPEADAVQGDVPF